MYGWGVMKTLGMTLYHFLMTYVDDIRLGFGKRYTRDHLAERQGPHGKGIFTVQYPLERRPLPERTRSLPFMVIDAQTGRLRCTACGICAQICPAQCIWVERAKDPETGRPQRYPAAYHIDIGMCMTCGFCAEFCPFDAIKMDVDFELSTYSHPGFVSAQELAKPEAYHAKIHPTAYAEEQAKRKT